MPDSNEPFNTSKPEGSIVGKEYKQENVNPKIPNPFEKNHSELSPEALDSVEQFKEAQTERD